MSRELKVKKSKVEKPNNLSAVKNGIKNKEAGRKKMLENSKVNMLYYR